MFLRAVFDWSFEVYQPTNQPAIYFPSVNFLLLPRGLLLCQHRFYIKQHTHKTLAGLLKPGWWWVVLITFISFGFPCLGATAVDKCVKVLIYSDFWNKLDSLCCYCQYIEEIKLTKWGMILEISDSTGRYQDFYFDTDTDYLKIGIGRYRYLFRYQNDCEVLIFDTISEYL